MMKIIIFLSLLFLLLNITHPVFAEEKVRFDLDDHIKIKTKDISHNEFHSSINAGVDQEEREENKENNNDFKISGEITTVAGDNFTVSGQTVFIEPELVVHFRQKGILKVGSRVIVKGVIKNGIKLAKDINVVGIGQGRFQFDFKNFSFFNSPSPTPTSSPSSSPTIQPSSQASVSGQVRIKANGSVDQVVGFLQQVLSFLKNLL